jgi:hypothetical protein
MPYEIIDSLKYIIMGSRYGFELICKHTEPNRELSATYGSV